MKNIQKFILCCINDKDRKYIKFIAAYDQELYNSWVETYGKNYVFIKEFDINSGKSFYQVNTYMDFYDDEGGIYSDYELWKKGLKNPPEGYTFDDYGNLREKTVDEKKIDGDIKLEEDEEIVGGKVSKIVYYDLMKLYNTDIDSFIGFIKGELLKLRNKQVNNSTVNYNGIIYQVNDDAINSLIQALNTNKVISWRSLDNKMNDLNEAAIKGLAGLMQKSIQNIYISYFKKLDYLKQMISDKKDFLSIIKMLESYTGEKVEELSVFEETSVSKTKKK